MGRGNVCTFGECEGLYFVDYENFKSENENEMDIEMGIDDFIYMLQSDMKARFKSFTDIDDYVNESKAILENELFYVVIQDNEWSLAVKLIQKEEGCYDNYNKINLQKKHYLNYLNNLKECLLNQFEEIQGYAGAYTHTTITKER